MPHPRIYLSVCVRCNAILICFWAFFSFSCLIRNSNVHTNDTAAAVLFTRTVSPFIERLCINTTILLALGQLIRLLVGLHFFVGAEQNEKMKIKNVLRYGSVVCLIFSFVASQDIVLGRVLSISKKPDPDNAAVTARWLVSQNSWGVLNTISMELGGSPFGNVVSFSDGLPDKGFGIPYFYLTTLDPTARNALKDQRSSLTISEYPIGTCGKIDPENPTCAKLTLTGKLKLVDGNSKEAEFAQTALFSKHPEMKDWPKDHDFKIFKLEIEDIFLIDWFGGPKPLTPDQYLHPKMYKTTFIL
ncbi:uncharacterized protein LOC131168224 [Malania oleifera]|uniref:uncharacterized protein LOC131168224 n=1 Tax=Malania oleifera TaxID=397392 RepID=UPI0025ADFFFF|nr:uncharacterized protein LOC131168224 [Malania oleifera]